MFDQKINNENMRNSTKKNKIKTKTPKTTKTTKKPNTKKKRKENNTPTKLYWQYQKNVQTKNTQTFFKK